MKPNCWCNICWESEHLQSCEYFQLHYENIGANSIGTKFGDNQYGMKSSSELKRNVITIHYIFLIGVLYVNENQYLFIDFWFIDYPLNVYPLSTFNKVLILSQGLSVIFAAKKLSCKCNFLGDRIKGLKLRASAS